VKTSLAVLGLLCVSHATGCARALPPEAPPRASTDSPEESTAYCERAGKPVTLARNVYEGNLHAEAHVLGGGFTVAVLDGVDACLSAMVSASGELEGTVLAECPAPPSPGKTRASSRETTYLARQVWDADGSPRLSLGFVSYEAPHAFFGMARAGQPRMVEHTLRAPPGAAGGESDPALATYHGDRFALAWVQGDTVRVQPVGGYATLLGAPLDVSVPGTSSPGAPALVFNDEGDGVVAFAAQTDEGYNVLATPIHCFQ